MRFHVERILMMEGEPRKRKMDDSNNGQGQRRRRQHQQHGTQAQEDDAEDEEEKIDKFFALIRSTRDMRDRIRRRRSLATTDELLPVGDEVVKEGASASQVTTSWNPSFQPQDFMEGEAAAAPPATTTQEGGGGIGHQAGKGNEKDEGVLDLNLSL